MIKSILGRLVRFGILLCGVLVLSGCGTAYNPLRTEVESPDFVPEWYRDLPEDQDFLYTSAKGRSENPSQAVQRARRRATGHFSTVLTEAVDRLPDSGADTGTEGPRDWEPVLDRINSDPSSVLELDARRVSRDGDEYRAYVLLKTSLNNVLPPKADDVLRNRLRDLYERLNRERTASRGAS